jgi:hypothetical protein
MEASLGLTSFTSAAVVVFLINKAKAASWFPVLEKGKTVSLRAASVVAAFATSIGIHYSYNPSTRIFSFAVPTVTALAFGFWHMLNQYAMQETIHQITKPRTAAVAVTAASSK